MTTADQPERKRVVYTPPSNEVIGNYARDVCAALAEHENDPSMMNGKIVSGFANFIKVVASIQAKRLTAEAEKAEQDAANDETGATREQILNDYAHPRRLPPGCAPVS